MRRALALLLLISLFATGCVHRKTTPTVAAAETAPTLADVEQGHAIRAASFLFCRTVHLSFVDGTSSFDCSFEDHTLRIRASQPTSDPYEAALPMHLAQLWCEGNRWESQFSLHRAELIQPDGSCSQLCELYGRSGLPGGPDKRGRLTSNGCS
jgi:hypothetical protein